VEFALVVPILLLIVAGIINFGLIFSAQISLNSAARDAARAAVVQDLSGNGLTCATVASRARSSAVTIGAPSNRIGVTVTAPDGTTQCALAAGAGTATGSTTTQMCTGSASSSGQLVVALTLAYTSPIPLVPPSAATLTSNGSFTCEYT
jgi:Flp pilus assembly protein TadG